MHKIVIMNLKLSYHEKTPLFIAPRMDDDMLEL